MHNGDTHSVIMAMYSIHGTEAALFKANNVMLLCQITLFILLLYWTPILLQEPCTNMSTNKFSG